VQVSNAVGDAVGNFELRGKYGFSLKGYFKGKQLAVCFFFFFESVVDFFQSMDKMCSLGRMCSQATRSKEKACGLCSRTRERARTHTHTHTHIHTHTSPLLITPCLHLNP
jgi:hypothetical protein